MGAKCILGILHEPETEVSVLSIWLWLRPASARWSAEALTFELAGSRDDRDVQRSCVRAGARHGAMPCVQVRTVPPESRPTLPGKLGGQVSTLR